MDGKSLIAAGPPQRLDEFARILDVPLQPGVIVRTESAIPYWELLTFLSDRFPDVTMRSSPDYQTIIISGGAEGVVYA